MIFLWTGNEMATLLAESIDTLPLLEGMGKVIFDMCEWKEDM